MIVDLDGKRVNLPDFFIIGAAKCGTTSLYYYLKQHPKIFMPTVKEPRFFYYKGIQKSHLNSVGNNIVFTIEDYINLLKKAKEGQIVGEASPNYLYRYDLVIPNLKEVYGEKYKKLKIIAILRNPAERAYSHWLFFKKLNRENFSFMEAINKKERDYIKQGMYHDMVKSYLNEFRYMRIYLFEDLIKDTGGVIKDLFNFLDVDPNYNVKYEAVVNPSGIPKSEMLVKIINRLNGYFKSVIPDKYKFKFILLRDKIYKKILYKTKLDNSAKNVLIDIFKEDTLKLQNLINRNLKHWVDKF